MNGCEECIVYEIRHNMLEAGECLGCGKKSMSWKQGKYGNPYMECSECGSTIGVDLNTPCELDHIFKEKVTVFMAPQKELPDKKMIMMLAKDFGMNALQMHKSLKGGFNVELLPYKLESIIRDLLDSGVEYRLEGYVDLREKYPFYRECGYPYSAMRICIANDDQ